MRISKRRHAFTLLEVIIASVIMMLTMAALVVTFRTGIHAWDTGHGMSEIMQTARITQQVMLRDLNNLVFLDESNYNRTFRQQLEALAVQEGDQDGSSPGPGQTARRLRGTATDVRRALANLNNDGQPGNVAANGELTPESIAMPIDLSFVGVDGGKTDQLSFARHYVPRLPSDPDTWGVRRVNYYVKDGTLYREESDPFGFRPGQQATEYYSNSPKLFDTASQFMKPKGDAAAARDFLPLPLQFNVAEPLCDGVELLNVTYGYFIDYEWHEVDDWDSGARRYRNPPETDYLAASQASQRGAAVLASGMPNPLGNNNLAAAIARASRNKPDELPGYLAVQLGVRAPGKKGRLFSFTFYYSMPQAQETDVLVQTGQPQMGRGVGNADLSSSLRNLTGSR